MISIYTFTCGRELYLRRLVLSLEMNAGDSVAYEHHICFQGVKPSAELEAFLHDPVRQKTTTAHYWEKNVGTGEGNNRIVGLLNGELIIKLDDDATICSPQFLTHVMAIHRLVPDAVFSAYPVGLIRHAGGTPGTDHFVKYSAETDTYYTFRCVPHVSGMVRIAPAETAKAIRCPYDLDDRSGVEDVSFALACQERNVPMYYLENAIISEHQETGLGQYERYPEYYQGRKRKPIKYAQTPMQKARKWARRSVGKAIRPFRRKAT